MKNVVAAAFAFAALPMVAQTLSPFPGFKVGAEGGRANAVKDALVPDGVPATTITVIGNGETNLLASTGDGVPDPLNRRVEIVIW